MWPSTILLAAGVLAQPVPPPVAAEVAPPPRSAGPAVRVTAVNNGYRVTLTRPSAERLLGLLDNTDEAKLAAALRDRAKVAAGGPDEKTAATLEFVAFLASRQIPAFRKALRENAGPGGAVITFTGLQAPVVEFRRPRLGKAAEALRGAMPLFPEDAREAIEAARAVARTTPLLWTIEPRP